MRLNITKQNGGADEDAILLAVVVILLSLAGGDECRDGEVDYGKKVSV